jgi:hypothetical protein
LVGFCLLSQTAFAQAPAIALSPAGCVTRDANAVVAASVTPDTAWSSVRLYFRRAFANDFYYMEMRSAGDGAYWAALPLLGRETTAIEYYVAVRDAEGRESMVPLEQDSVDPACTVQLTEDQLRFAQNLVIGETTPLQSNSAIDGFECTGVISRIQATGELAPDEYCRQVLIAEAAADDERRVLIPLLILGTGGVVAIINETDPPEASSPRPR